MITKRKRTEKVQDKENGNEKEKNNNNNKKNTICLKNF